MAEKWRKKGFEHRKEIGADYNNEKREFEIVMKRPFITIKVGLPDGFEDLLGQFLKLEPNGFRSQLVYREVSCFRMVSYPIFNGVYQFFSQGDLCTCAR